MIISINWLKKFTPITVPVDELVMLIGARLVEIEEVIDLGAKYKDVVVTKVITCEKLEGSDHLNVARLDDGNVTPDIERDEDGYIQVVCGAPNVRAGILVAWLPPNTTVPETFGDKEPFVLDARKLHGAMSNGMIASARELALFDEHSSILELDKEIAPGSSFAKAYELDDYLLDIENKSLTHRPDTFGIIGFAREVAAIQGNKFTTPDWLANTMPSFPDKTGEIEAPIVTIDTPELSNRYQAVVLSGVDGTVKSPLQIQTYLARVGVRPISAVVDVTNYLMMLTGQPLHAFDYDKLVQAGSGKADIHVRAGRDQETLVLLDGRVIILTSDDIVIAAGDQAIGLAGAMGGATTEIDGNTKTIILECATFNLYNLRATQMRHGIFSEAITRFTKGQPAGLTAPVLANAVRMMGEFAGAKQASDVTQSYPGLKAPMAISMTNQKINNILGSAFTTTQMAETMRDVEFEIRADNDTLSFTPPFWRNDIHISEDIVEEIGRLNGFDSIEPVLPKRDFSAVQPSRFDSIRADVRRALTRAGANEALTYSFIHGDILAKATQRPEDSYRLINSLSPDLQYYRQTLTPSLLSAVHGNIKQGYDQFALFEVNKVHPKQHGMTDENVPAEVDMVALIVTSKKSHNGAPYYHAKKMLQYLGDSLGLDPMYSSIETDPHYPVTAPFEHRRSALVTDKKTDTFIGIVGEYKRSVARGFKLPDYTAGFEIGSLALLDAIQKLTSSYTPISRYPSAERDVCFQVASVLPYREIIDAARQALDATGLEVVIVPIDIYQASPSERKNVTIRVRLTSHQKTLTGDEIAHAIAELTASVMQATDATVV